MCCDERALPRFDVLRRRRNEAVAFLYAFDLLELDGTTCAESRSRSARRPWRASCARPGTACASTSTSPDWLKLKNPEALAVRREAEEDWGR